jgi:hypothetical protein
MGLNLVDPAFVTTPTDALWNGAGAYPSLDLPFARTKSLVDATTGAELVTFSRTSDATFVASNGLIQTASAGSPRFDHNPVTGESLGLLVEESRTNLLLQSEAFDSASWLPTATHAGITANDAVAPTGQATADLFTCLTTDDVARRLTSTPAISVSNATVYTASLYVKAKNWTFMGIAINANTTNFNNSAGSCLFNLSTGAFTQVSAGVSATNAVNMGGGWWRVSVTATTVTTTATLVLTLHDANESLAASTVGVIGDGVYVWGAQLEVGSFPTSYIPTTTAAATRAADVASISGSNFSSWYNQAEGTVFAQFATIFAGGADAPVANPGLFAINNSGGSGFRGRASRLVISNAASIRWGSRVSLTTNELSAQIHNSHITRGQSYAVSFAYGNAFLAGSVNGTIAEIADSNYSSLPAADQLLIGAQTLGGTPTPLNGHIRRLTYWPQALPSRLQAITQ